MIIRYTNGYTVEAILLSRNGNTMRVARQNSDDVLELTEVNGTWITEECEPVQVDPAWTRHGDQPVVKIDDCVCSRELAARLLHMLFSGENDPEINAAIGRAGAPPLQRQIV